MLAINSLSEHSEAVKDVISGALRRVCDRGWYVLGPEVESFEDQFSRYVGVSRCVSVANGTDALEIAMRALGINAGCQVATVASAGMYATTALLAIGAVPHFMDIDLCTRTVSLQEVQRAIEAGVRAVVITHLYGRVVPDILRIVEVCGQYGVPVIEDCAQAHGARLDGMMAGAFGDVASFSFYPTKNLGALGDGGAVLTNRLELAERVARLRQYGWSSKYEVADAGGRNSRLDEIQAAVLREFLPLLDGWNIRRREIARLYSAEIVHPKVSTPESHGDDDVAHLYVVTSEQRDALRQYLHNEKISTDVHYPIPDYRQPIFGDRYASIELPNTEWLARTALTLPCYPEMKDSDVRFVVEAINRWVV